MNNPLKEKKEKIAQHLEVEIDEISDFLLDVVWEYIVNYIGYDPMLQKRIENLVGNDLDKLYVTARPIKSIEKFILNNNGIKNLTYEDNYINICTKKGYCHCEFMTLYEHPTKDKIYIEYMAGYEGLPNLLLMAAIMLLETLSSSTGEEGNLKSYKINTISYTFKDFAERSSEFQDLLSGFMGVSI